MRAVLKRNYLKSQTLGELSIYDGGNLVAKFATLELPFLSNQKQISCIPEGTYTVTRRYSKKYGDHFHILYVPGRNLILIHSGNYTTQTNGCILIGLKHADINNDELTDVTFSKVAMLKLNDIINEDFELKITR